MDNEGFKENFAMIIPLGAHKPELLEEDPRGAPIYRGCGAGGPCACTGRCREITGWSQDPDKLAAHREYIKKHNELQTKGLPFNYTIKDNGDGTKTWTREA